MAPKTKTQVQDQSFMVRIPGRFKKVLEEMAKENNRPLSWQVKDAIEKSIKDSGRNVPLPQE